VTPKEAEEQQQPKQNETGGHTAPPPLLARQTSVIFPLGTIVAVSGAPDSRNGASRPPITDGGKIVGGQMVEKEVVTTDYSTASDNTSNWVTVVARKKRRARGPPPGDDDAPIPTITSLPAATPPTGAQIEEEVNHSDSQETPSSPD